MQHRLLISLPIAILVTLVAIIYQRSTGPTYPKKITMEWQGEEHRFKLPRSHGGETDARPVIPKMSENLTGELIYRRFPTDDPWTHVPLEVQGNQLAANLPNQPPAGKLQYFMKIQDGSEQATIGSEHEPVMIRYKGDVPIWILAPHIFCMFFAMLLSSTAAIEAMQRTTMSLRFSQLALGFLVLGGMVLGPLVQKFAFGVYWAGFPYGYDLTDNKLLIGVIGWCVGLTLIWRFKQYWGPVFAAIVLLAMYSIPHSMMGSELNYDSGKVGTAVQEIKLGKPSY